MTANPTPNPLATLRELCQRATPGPDRDSADFMRAQFEYAGSLLSNPAYILTLLDRLEAAERVVEAARRGYDANDCDCTGLDICARIAAYDRAIAGRGET